MKNGFYQLLPFSEAVKRYLADTTISHSLSNEWVFNCINAGDGKVWIGSDGGLNIFDPLTHIFQVLTEKDLAGIKSNRIIPAIIDTIHQKAWLRTQDEVYEMDIAARKCQHVIFKDTNDHTIPNIEMASPYYGYWASYKNTCIIPADYGDHFGIFITDSDGIEAHEVLTFRRGEIDETNGHIAIIAHDQFLLLQKLGSTTIYTFINSNGKWKRIFTPLDSMQIQSIIYEQRTQTYWAVGEGQLIHCDREFKIIHRYTTKDGLPELEIYSVIPDNDENIWFNTDRSICRLNTKTGKITTLAEIDGFQNQTFTPYTNGIKDRYGNLYFQGGMYGKGLNVVNPSEFRETYPPSTMYIRSLEVNEKPLLLSADVTHISLKYFENNISIETGIIDYYSKGKSGIRYKLEGINNNWQYAPANYTIRYDGLAPGKYTLVMQASNATNEFNGPVKTISVQITPPFWKTWWFIFMVVVSIAIAINALFQFRLKQKMQVLKVRQKLHRDLHDDVGATLSSVKVYSEILQNNLNNPLITELIKNNAAEMIDKLEVIAWATNPQHDTFKSFKELMFKHASPLCYAKNIDLNIQCDGMNENMVMPGDIRQNLFLIFKEAINNTIKYSDASQCNVQTFIRDHKFYFEIKDNGKGFSGTIKVNGTGWKNMQKRVKELNGKITIASEPGKGTIINITLHYPFRNTKFMV
jgi:hypothetical protein